MKLHRLIEIIILLMNRHTVTAADLAERFKVSTRTVYRDIEVLSASGVPIFTSQGVGGGISIMEDYSINRTLLSDNDKDSILIALQTLQSTKYPETESVVEKLGSIFKGNTGDWIKIDFSPWGADPNSNNRFSDIKTAILQTKIIEIEYINSHNIRSMRTIEPMQLEFKYQAWYLYGYCMLRKDYRTFRISRIKKVKITDKMFDRNQIHITENTQNEIIHRESPYVHLKLQFTKEALFRLYDDYDVDIIKENGDGTYGIEVNYPDDDWLIGYLLSFGSYVKVLEPDRIKNILNEKILKMQTYYN